MLSSPLLCLRLLLISLLLMLTACGGGGGGSASSTGNTSTGSGSQNNGGSSNQVSEPTFAPGIGQALLGPIVDANAGLYEEGRFNSSPVCTTTTTSANSSLGPGVLDFRNCNVNPNLLYLIVIRNGFDIDVNDDGNIDTTPTSNQGVIRGLISGEDILAGEFRINILTEVAFQNVSDLVTGGSSANEILSSLNLFAAQLVREDLNGDNIIDNSDLLSFSPRLNAGSLQQDSAAARNEILNAILTNNQEELRIMSGQFLRGVSKSYYFRNFLLNRHSFVHLVMNDLLIDDDILYVVGSDTGASDNNLVIMALDISDPLTITLVDEVVFRNLGTEPGQSQLAYENEHLYIATDEVGLFVAELDDSSNLSASLVINDADIHAIATDGNNHLFLSFFGFGINNESVSSYDVSDPFNPLLLDTINDLLAFNMEVQNDLLYVYGDLAVLDITSPENMLVHNRTSLSSGSGESFAVDNGFIYSAYNDGDSNGLRIVNVGSENFGSTSLISDINFPSEIILNDNFLHLIVYRDHVNNLLLTYQITSPGNLKLISTRISPLAFYLKKHDEHLVASNGTEFFILNKVGLTQGSSPLSNRSPIFISSSETSTDDDKIKVFYTAKAIDPDGDQITYSLVEGDLEYFSIDAASGELSTRIPLDYENPVDQNMDNVYELTLRASDSKGGFNLLNFSVDVSDIDEAAVPVITSPSNLILPDNFIDDSIYLVEAENTYENAMIYFINGGADADLFSLDALTGSLQLQDFNTSFDQPQDANGDNVYEVEIFVAPYNTNSGAYSLLNLRITVVDATINTSYQAGVFRPSSEFKDACEAPRDSITYDDFKGSTLTEKHWLRSWSNETYLWYSEIPDINPASDVTVSDYFDALKTNAVTPSGAPKDQFHYTVPTQEFEQFSQSGIGLGYGIHWIFGSPTPPRELHVAYVEPGSSAHLAGITRGMRIMEINGEDLVNGNTQALINNINAALFPDSTGQTHTFGVLASGAADTGTYPQIDVSSENTSASPVLTTNTIPTTTGNVGYLVFNEHIATAESALIDAVSDLADDSVTDLVLDLRYNGGGLLAIASQLAYMIAGDANTSGRIFETTQFNDKHPVINPVSQQAITPIPFIDESIGFSEPAGQSLPTLDLNRVFIISGNETCSASESIINSLNGIGVEVVLIGSSSCGKPYGFYPQDNCGTTYFTIQFQGVNDIGFGDYPDGFTPANSGDIGVTIQGCSVADDISKDLGDLSEERLAAALAWRESPATCPTPPPVASLSTIQIFPFDLIPIQSAQKNSFLQNNRILWMK